MRRPPPRPCWVQQQVVHRSDHEDGQELCRAVLSPNTIGNLKLILLQCRWCVVYWQSIKRKFRRKTCKLLHKTFQDLNPDVWLKPLTCIIWVLWAIFPMSLVFVTSWTIEPLPALSWVPTAKRSTFGSHMDSLTICWWWNSPFCRSNSSKNAQTIGPELVLTCCVHLSKIIVPFWTSKLQSSLPSGLRLQWGGSFHSRLEAGGWNSGISFGAFQVIFDFPIVSTILGMILFPGDSKSDGFLWGHQAPKRSGKIHGSCPFLSSPSTKACAGKARRWWFLSLSGTVPKPFARCFKVLESVDQAHQVFFFFFTSLSSWQTTDFLQITGENMWKNHWAKMLQKLSQPKVRVDILAWTNAKNSALLEELCEQDMIFGWVSPGDQPLAKMVRKATWCWELSTIETQLTRETVFISHL